MPIKGISTPVLARMSGKCTVDFVTGCWPWIASKSSQGKYPTISLARGESPQYAYKLAWESANGPMPTTPCPDGSDRWEFHHSCENRACCNPAHIQLVTRKQHAEIHRQLRAAMKVAA